MEFYVNVNTLSENLLKNEYKTYLNTSKDRIPVDHVSDTIKINILPLNYRIPFEGPRKASNSVKWHCLGWNRWLMLFSDVLYLISSLYLKKKRK